MIWSFFLVLAELVNFQPSGKCIYNQKFGQLDDDSPLIGKFITLIPNLEDFDSGSESIGKITFIYSGFEDLLFVIVADKSEDMMNLLQALENMKVAFSEKYFQHIKEGKDDPALFRSFRDDVNKALSAITEVEEAVSVLDEIPAPTQTETAMEPPTPPTEKKMVKIAFIGNTGVGKRTLLNLLFSGAGGTESPTEESEMVMKKGPISDNYNALLITLPNQMIESGKTQFLSNTDVVLIVSDSVFKDVMATRKVYETVKAALPNAKYGVIANKQDVSGAVEGEAIAKVYEIATLTMIATDPANYDQLKNYIISLIESA